MSLGSVEKPLRLRIIKTVAEVDGTAFEISAQRFGSVNQLPGEFERFFFELAGEAGDAFRGAIELLTGKITRALCRRRRGCSAR